MSARRQLVAVIGATATGKTEVAASIAERFDGEVVGADAYQLYEGLDIGTAKPDESTRRRVPHHLIDITTPDDSFSLGRYLSFAGSCLNDIWSRGKLPVVAGGSGQYVWALLEGWQVPRVPADPTLRATLEAFAVKNGPAALYARLATLDPAGARKLEPNNVRRVVRALELVTSTGLPLAACQIRTPIDAQTLVLGLRCSREELHRRIDARVEAMFAAGFVREVENLRDQGWGDTIPVRNGIGYKEVSAYLDSQIDLGEAKQRSKLATHRLARNQSAWFKESDPRILWIDAGLQAAAEAVDKVAAFGSPARPEGNRTTSESDA